MKQEEIERFQNWLQEELDLRNITPNKLAQKAGISHSVFSRVREGKLPKWQTCAKIAAALDVDPAEVFRAASLLTPLSEKEEFWNKISYMYYRMPPEKKQLVIHILKGFAELSKTKGEIDTGVHEKNLLTE
jgi:transcriptional regulator with XRE-family HTH domain